MTKRNTLSTYLDIQTSKGIIHFGLASVHSAYLLTRSLSTAKPVINGLWPKNSIDHSTQPSMGLQAWAATNFVSRKKTQKAQKGDKD
jgi:hypothetical protein